MWNTGFCAIIGGGLSGALVAYQLLRQGPKGMSVALVGSATLHEPESS